jgi:hypothetical protein
MPSASTPEPKSQGDRKELQVVALEKNVVPARLHKQPGPRRPDIEARTEVDARLRG